MNPELIRQAVRAANLIGCLICLPAAWRIAAMALTSRREPDLTGEMRAWLLWLSVAVFILVGVGGVTWAYLLISQQQTLSQWPGALYALTTFALDGALYALLGLGKRARP